MIQIIFSRIGWFILLFLLQILIFNHIHLFGYATPMPYLYFIMLLPSSTPRWVSILLGFILGLLIDIFTNTPGMAAASLCCVGLVAPPLLNLFSPHDREDDVILPSIHTMERSGFLKYAVTLTLLHCSLFFTIELFTFQNWQDLLFYIGGSSVLTLLFVIAFEMLRSRRG